MTVTSLTNDGHQVKSCVNNSLHPFLPHLQYKHPQQSTRNSEYVRDHPGKTVCTLDDSDIPNQRWAPDQIMCKQFTPSISTTSSIQTSTTIHTQLRVCSRPPRQ
eukprot:1106652_1